MKYLMTEYVKSEIHHKRYYTNDGNDNDLLISIRHVSFTLPTIDRNNNVIFGFIVNSLFVILLKSIFQVML